MERPVNLSDHPDEGELRLDIRTGIDPDPAWDALAMAGGQGSVFTTSGWLAAWAATVGAGNDLVVIRVVRDQQLLAAAAFARTAAGLGFAGAGPSDYGDILVDPGLSEEAARECLSIVLEAAFDAGYRGRFQLDRLPEDSLTRQRLEALPVHVELQRRACAPRMDMAAAPEVLRKKSLKRHDNGLRRQGTVTCETFRRAVDIDPRLDGFFELHERRWAETDTPSLFLDRRNRNFYRAATAHLDALDALRYTEVRLDGALVAAHFGFLWGGRFIWYKPCFDPALAKLSPGEVLIKRLVELAMEEGATLFDFTLGAESFKLRFATALPHVYSAELSRSQVGGLLMRARAGARWLVSAVRGD